MVALTAKLIRAGLALVAVLTLLIPAQKYAVMDLSSAVPSATMETPIAVMVATQAATLSLAGDAKPPLLEVVTSASLYAKTAL
jgi:hypothetical protein